MTHPFSYAAVFNCQSVRRNNGIFQVLLTRPESAGETGSQEHHVIVNVGREAGDAQVGLAYLVTIEPMLLREIEMNEKRHRKEACGEDVPRWAEFLMDQNDETLRRLENIMSTIADLQASVAKNTDAEASVVTLLKGIAQQLKDAQGDPAAIAAVIADIDKSTAAAAAAVVENTPAA